VLGAVCVLALTLLLVRREQAVAAGHRLGPIARNLLTVLAPLLIVFAALVASRLAAML
jgi:hypothetical protein